MGNLLTTFLKMVRWKIRNSIQPLYTPLQMTDRLKFKIKIKSEKFRAFWRDKREASVVLFSKLCASHIVTITEFFPATLSESSLNCVIVK